MTGLCRSLSNAVIIDGRFLFTKQRVELSVLLYLS